VRIIATNFKKIYKLRVVEASPRTNIIISGMVRATCNSSISFQLLI